MATTHGAGHPAPLLTRSECVLVEAGMLSGRRAILDALARGEATTLAEEAMVTAIASHLRETHMRWTDIDRERIQPLEGRLTARLVPIQARSFGRTPRPRSPYGARPRRARAWVRPACWALAVVASTTLWLVLVALLRAAWAAWGGAR